jgi:hypothetical protein
MRQHRLHRQERLIKSVSYVVSVRKYISTPPASTILPNRSHEVIGLVLTGPRFVPPNSHRIHPRFRKNVPENPLFFRPPAKSLPRPLNRVSRCSSSHLNSRPHPKWVVSSRFTVLSRTRLTPISPQRYKFLANSSLPSGRIEFMKKQIVFYTLLKSMPLTIGSNPNSIDHRPDFRDALDRFHQTPEDVPSHPSTSDVDLAW